MPQPQESFIQGGRSEREPSIDDVRLDDGSPVADALLVGMELSNDNRQNAKSVMHKLLEEDKDFVMSLHGRTAQDVHDMVLEKLNAATPPATLH